MAAAAVLQAALDGGWEGLGDPGPERDLVEEELRGVIAGLYSRGVRWDAVSSRGFPTFDTDGVMDRTETGSW